MKEPVTPEPPPLMVQGSAALVGQCGMLDVIDRAREAVERDMIVEALVQCEGNATKAARLLKISKRCMLYKISEYKITRGSEK